MGIPKILESPKKESNRVRYKGEKVRISLRFSYFPVLFLTFFFSFLKMCYGISDCIRAAEHSLEFKLLDK